MDQYLLDFLDRLVLVDLFELYRADVLTPKYQGLVAIRTAKVAVEHISIGEICSYKVAALQRGMGKLAEREVMLRKIRLD